MAQLDVTSRKHDGTVRFNFPDGHALGNGRIEIVLYRDTLGIRFLTDKEVKPLSLNLSGHKFEINLEPA
jgi:hypothetical protein